MKFYRSASPSAQSSIAFNATGVPAGLMISPARTCPEGSIPGPRPIGASVTGPPQISAISRAQLAAQGVVYVPSDYGEPYPITQRLIADGRDQLVLRTPLSLPFPVRFVQGTADTAVSVETALRLLDHADSPDMRLTLIDGADHRLSNPDELAIIVSNIEDVIARQEL